MEIHEPVREALESEQTIIIYFNRKQTIINAWLWIGILFFMGFTWVFLLIIQLTSGGLVVPLLGFFLTLMLFGISAWDSIAPLFHIQDPRLVINQQGIWLGKQISPIGSAFLSWDQIGKISSNRFLSEDYLCIYPKASELYLSQFSWWERFQIRLSSIKKAPLRLSQNELALPIEQIFQQLLLNMLISLMRMK